MSKEESKKFYFYSIGLVISTIAIYFVINILYKNNIIEQITANILGLAIYLMALLLALFIAGITGDTLELFRMKRRFRANVKMILLAVFMGLLAFWGGFLVVQKYTSISFGNFVLNLGITLKSSWYTLIVGAVSLEAGFRGFLQNYFEHHYSVFGSSMMTGITYAIWLTLFAFISENPSLLCLIFVALQFILISIFLGFLTRLCKKNLYPAIAFHFVWNVIAAAMNFQNRIEFLIYSDLFLLLLCVLIMAMYQMTKKHAHKKRDAR